MCVYEINTNILQNANVIAAVFHSTTIKTCAELCGDDDDYYDDDFSRVARV